MTLLDVSFFEVTKYITHPISLVAYACALVTYYFISKNINDRKKLEANPEAYRATAERLDIKFVGIAKSERGTVTLRILNNRILSQLIIAFSLISGGLIIAYVSIRHSESENEFKRKEAEGLRADERRQDSLDYIENQIKMNLVNERQKRSVDLIIMRGKGIIDSVLSGQKRAWEVSFNYYSSDVMRVIREIEVARNYDNQYSKRIIDRSLEFRYTRFEDPRSQRAMDSAHAINDTRFYLLVLEEFRETL
ncbi:hypothetical protein ACD591_10030 [Rufibacter glacialis]|uniref:Uncharacterized protein n=1 Tax=Rufibacter glacialis TaxID=1259555 RepID=A0A5M8QBM1_9BACT|nr:hypothetical protein [Rufibacter glacialis]KAA6431892.1 hypothetical protein FOE74_17445 [Rufibacter glacialis]GGK80649.1 hypothetical protein GCM10011405_30520 [Rufibacter glacialis]